MQHDVASIIEILGGHGNEKIRLQIKRKLTDIMKIMYRGLH
jgi:hypothetical protein